MIGISGYANTPFSGFVYGGYTAASSAAASSDAGKAEVIKNPGESTKVSPGRRSSPAECQTCKERKYQDGSDENVSFKSAQHIAPEAAAARVRGHEQEHVANAYDKAEEKGGKVLRASVTLKYAICPECGRTYISGGETNTKIEYSHEEESPYMKARKKMDAQLLPGMGFDMSA